MDGHKLDNSEALKFIFAGKSIVTLLNSKTGNRFTFKVKQAKDSNMFFVSVLTRPESYSYIGTCVEGKFRHGRKSDISADAQSVKVFEYVLSKLILGTLPDFIEAWHEEDVVNVDDLLQFLLLLRMVLDQSVLSLFLKWKKEITF
jgi:hypothetical protein